MEWLIEFLSDPQAQSVIMQVAITHLPNFLQKFRRKTIEDQLRDCLHVTWKDTIKHRNWTYNTTNLNTFVESLQKVKGPYNKETLRQVFQKAVVDQKITDEDIEYFESSFRKQVYKPEHDMLWKEFITRFIEKGNKTSASNSQQYKLSPNAPCWNNSSIVGRATFVADLCKELQDNKDNKPHIYLYGMGGIGKSEILNKVYEHFLNNPHYFDHVALLSYDGSMDNSLTQITYPRDVSVEIVWTYVRGLCEKASVLFLIDDIRWQSGKTSSVAIDGSFDKLFTLNATVLFASRSLTDGLKDKFTRIKPVELLPVTECKKIFKDKRYQNKDYPLSETDEKILADIMEKMAGCNPLVAMNLGVMTRSRRCNITELAELLKEKRFNICKGFDNDATLQEEFNKLYRLEDIKDTKDRRLLEAFALFPNIPLSRETCIHWLHEDANMHKDECSLALNRLSDLTWLMLHEHEYNGSEVVAYSMHQLVQTAVITQTNISFKNHRKLIEHLIDAISIGSNDSFEKARPYIPYATSVIQILPSKNNNVKLASLMNWIGTYYRNVANYPEALNWYNKALTIHEKILNKEHSDTANIYRDIAFTREYQGDYTGALELFEKALDICKKALGPEHSDIATIYTGIALVHIRQKECDKALEWAKQALAIREKVLGKEHSDTAISYNNLAFLYQYQHKYAEALELYEKALAIYKKYLVNDHPRIATVYDNIANTHRDQAMRKEIRTWECENALESAQVEYKEALEWYKKALDIRERVLGKDHPDTATTYHNIALLHQYQRNDKEALEWYKKALDIRERVLGEEHPSIASTYGNIGCIYCRQGKRDDALELYKKVLAIREKVFGKDKAHKMHSDIDEYLRDEMKNV